jgi:hypothetical protein
MIKQGDKFHAYRRTTGKAIYGTYLNPKGIELTCVAYRDGVITCEEMSQPKMGTPRNLQVMTKYFTCWPISPAR